MDSKYINILILIVATIGLFIFANRDYFTKNKIKTKSKLRNRKLDNIILILTILLLITYSIYDKSKEAQKITIETEAGNDTLISKNSVFGELELRNNKTQTEINLLNHLIESSDLNENIKDSLKTLKRERMVYRSRAEDLLLRFNMFFSLSAKEKEKLLKETINLLNNDRETDSQIKFGINSTIAELQQEIDSVERLNLNLRNIHSNNSNTIKVNSQLIAFLQTRLDSIRSVLKDSLKIVYSYKLKEQQDIANENIRRLEDSISILKTINAKAAKIKVFILSVQPGHKNPWKNIYVKKGKINTPLEKIDKLYITLQASSTNMNDTLSSTIIKVKVISSDGKVLSRLENEINVDEGIDISKSGKEIILKVGNPSTISFNMPKNFLVNPKDSSQNLIRLYYNNPLPDSVSTPIYILN